MSDGAPISDISSNAPTPAPSPVGDATKPFQAAVPKTGEKVAVLETTQGRIIFAFLPDVAPKTVASFQKLANEKFYDNTAFHRVIPDFMIQGGDSNSDPARAKGPAGTGDAGFKLKAEFNVTSHVRGVVSMARSQDPDSAGSQFFICVGNPTFLDNKYTAFGRVVSGMEVADKIVALQRDQNDAPVEIEKARVKSVRIATWPVK
ncbi:MAG: peptidylprolyl isomerase [Armatimonadota bacterium]